MLKLKQMQLKNVKKKLNEININIVFNNMKDKIF